MRLTPDEIYEILQEAYQISLAGYEWTEEHYPGLISRGWIHKPEPPEYPQPKSYIPGYMRSRKWKREHRG